MWNYIHIKKTQWQWSTTNRTNLSVWPSHLHYTRVKISSQSAEPQNLLINASVLHVSNLHHLSRNLIPSCPTLCAHFVPRFHEWWQKCCSLFLPISSHQLWLSPCTQAWSRKSNRRSRAALNPVDATAGWPSACHRCFYRVLRKRWRCEGAEFGLAGHNHFDLQHVLPCPAVSCHASVAEPSHILMSCVTAQKSDQITLKCALNPQHFPIYWFHVPAFFRNRLNSGFLSQFCKQHPRKKTFFFFGASNN